MENGQERPQVTIGAMTEGDLRRLIREEMSAQMKDVPNRADVNALVDARVAALRQEAMDMVRKAENESEARIKSAVGLLDAQISGLSQRISGMGENLDTLKAMLMSIDSKITEANKSMDARMSKVAADSWRLDARLDALEPKLQANTEAIFGNGDGVPGMRNQVAVLAAGAGTMRESLADIHRWMKRQNEMAEARTRQIERLWSLANSWWVRLGAVVLVASLLGDTGTNLIRLIGGLG